MSKHLDFWLPVNLFARGGAYDTFPEVAIISRLDLTRPVQKLAAGPYLLWSLCCFAYRCRPYGQQI